MTAPPQPGTIREGSVASDALGAGTAWDEYLMYVSMALLLVSTLADTGLIGDALKVIWLASLAVLTAYNAGAAFGVYLSSVALYSVLSFNGWGSVLERPDNYALMLVGAGVTLRALTRRPRRGWDRSMLVVGGFVVYGLVQMAGKGLLERGTFVEYMRTFGIPMFWFVLLEMYGFSALEFRALLRSLLVLGGYTALVSIVEHFLWYAVIVPPWIGTPWMFPIDASRNYAAITGRSGGLLMQSEFNALAMSLTFCLAILSTRLYKGRSAVLPAVVGFLCLVAVFFTGTRAAWLACAPAALVLLWAPSETRLQTHVKRFGLIAATAAAALSFVLLPSSFAKERMGETGAIYARLNLWVAALHMAGDRPLMGSGFNTYAANLPDYTQVMTVGEKRPYQDYPVHNTTLNVLVELGSIGLVLYAGALVAMVRRARAAFCGWGGREGPVWVAIFVAVYLLEEQFVIAHEPLTNQIFYGTLGAIAGLCLAGSDGRLPATPPSSLPDALPAS